ncbi:hypothetical protein DFP72DRAFT_1162491 [Ephemerocybe angulata]|uniref:Uncharacterized protein n=1 Tax=Ephemerocybe angulata TaxID=980116 RepID=A0A8H6IJY0_9AGAR|nr:hypothetical protein DFP72DRAFT_1162491 [Tulosesus angulatus]
MRRRKRQALYTAWVYTRSTKRRMSRTRSPTQVPPAPPSPFAPKNATASCSLAPVARLALPNPVDGNPLLRPLSPDPLDPASLAPALLGARSLLGVEEPETLFNVYGWGLGARWRDGRRNGRCLGCSRARRCPRRLRLELLGL